MSPRPQHSIHVSRDMIAAYILDPRSVGPSDDVVCSWYAQPDEQRKFRRLLSAARDSVERSRARYHHSRRYGDPAFIERARVLLDDDRARQVQGILHDMGMGGSTAEPSRTMEPFHPMSRAYEEEQAAYEEEQAADEEEQAADAHTRPESGLNSSNTCSGSAESPTLHQPQKLPQHKEHAITQFVTSQLRRSWPALILVIASALLSPVWTYHVNVRWQPPSRVPPNSSDCASAMFLPFAEAVGDIVHPLIRQFDWQIDAMHCEVMQAKRSRGCATQHHHLVPRIPCSYIGSTPPSPSTNSPPAEYTHPHDGVDLCKHLTSIENGTAALGLALRSPSGIWRSLVQVERSLDLFMMAFESIPPPTILTPWTSHLRTATPRALWDLPSNLLTLTVPYLFTYFAFPEYSSVTLWPILPPPNRKYDVARAEIRNAWSAATERLLSSLQSSVPEFEDLSNRLTQRIGQYPFLDTEAEDDDDNNQQDLLYRYPEEIRVRNLAMWQAKLPLGDQLRQAYQQIEAAMVTNRGWTGRVADIWEARGARVNGFETADWKLRRRWALASEGWGADGRRVTGDGGN